MKRKDFKDINQRHIEHCQDIVRQEHCLSIHCSNCPFNSGNVKNGYRCKDNGYKIWDPEKEIVTAKHSAKKFIELFQDKIQGDN